MTRIAATIGLLLALAAAAPTADAAARRCGTTAAAKSVTAKRTSCATARALAAAVRRVRHDRGLYAQAPRCAGDFCIVVRRWRCRPATGVAPRERCTRGRRVVSWVWR